MRNANPETGLTAEQENVGREEIVMKVHPETGLAAEQEYVQKGEVLRKQTLKQGCLQSMQMQKDRLWGMYTLKQDHP